MQLRPLSHKRSYQQFNSSPRELLRNPALLQGALPEKVSFFFQHPYATHAKDTISAVAQWSVDTEEPRLFRALYDGGFRGPVRLLRLDGSLIVAALRELEHLPLNPVSLDIDLAEVVTARQLPCLLAMLRSHNLRVEWLSCQVSVDMPLDAWGDLLSALDLAYELRSLSLTPVWPGTEAQAPSPCHAPFAADPVHGTFLLGGPLGALFKFKRILSLSRHTLLPLFVQDPTKLKAHPALARFASGEAEVDGKAEWENGFPLFNAALSCGEGQLAQALFALELAPKQRVCVNGTLLQAEMLSLLRDLGLSLQLRVRVRSAEDLRALTRWLEDCRPPLCEWTSILSGPVEADDLQALCAALSQLDEAPHTLSFDVQASFALRTLPGAQAQPSVHAEASARVRLLQLMPNASAPAHSAALALMIRCLMPLELKVSAQGARPALAVLTAWQQHPPCLPMERVGIECKEADVATAPTIDVLTDFLGRVHTIAHFVFQGGKGHWFGNDARALRRLIFNNDGLQTLSITAPNLTGKFIEQLGQVQTAQPGLARRVFGLGALTLEGDEERFVVGERFLQVHGNAKVSDALAKYIATTYLSQLPPRDRLALSLVSTHTHSAVAQHMFTEFDKAIQAGLLNVWGLHRLLTSPTGERNVLLEGALRLFSNTRLEQARQQKKDVPEHWARLEFLLAQEQALAMPLQKPLV